MQNDTQQLLASLIGGSAAADMPGSTPQIITGDAAVPVNRGGTYLLTKGSAAALTIAAPAAPGLEITIISDTAFAHVLTFTGNTLRGGTAAVATATCAAQKGASITLVSLFGAEAAWGVKAAVAQTLA